MKKLFTTLFLSSLLCPIMANDLIDKKVRNEVNDWLSESITAEQEEKDSSFGASNKSVVRIMFTQSIEATDSVRTLENHYKDCVAVIIDDAWAVASKKCRLAPGDNTHFAGEVSNVWVSDFKIKVGKKFQKVTDSFELKNLFLFRVLDEGKKPLFANSVKAKLFFVPQDVDLNSLTGKSGKYMVNRTDKNHPAYDEAHGKIEDNFQPYNTGRTLYTKGIDSIYRDKNGNVGVVLDWIKQVRAGDPLFFVEGGREYLMGFGDAVNLPDGRDGARAYKVSLLTDSDKNEILNQISKVDKATAKRIENNSLK